MKTYKTISRIFGAVALIAASSCTNILDQSSQTALQKSSAFDTPDHIALNVTGVYDAAQSGFYAGGAIRGYPFGAAHIEQGDNRGEDVVNTQAFFQVTYAATYDGVSPNNDFQFQTLFALINRANVVLEGLNGVVPVLGLTQATIDTYKGECRFLRALAYLELLKHFSRPYWDNPTMAGGGMPYRKTANTLISQANTEVSMPRATVAENYQDILADLNYAESVLPGTPLRLSRATKGAAIALKTRVYLNMKDWANVVVEGNKLAAQAVAPFSTATANGGYLLTSDPMGPFTAGNSKSNTESIFSIENDLTDNPGVNGSLPQVYNISVAPASGRALVAISPFLWNQQWFNATDIRKSASMVWINAEGTGDGGKGGYFTKKYSDVIGQSDNAPVIRYAEVLLNMAEALQRQSLGAPNARAFALYNAIRKRGNPVAGSDASLDDIGDFATGVNLLVAILNERRIEFVCEGMRWGDIARLADTTDPSYASINTWGGGIPAKVSNGILNYRPLYTGFPYVGTAIAVHAAIPYSNYKFIWPIPTSEVILNPVLAGQQNPGW